MTIGFDIGYPDMLAFTKHYVSTNKTLRRTWLILYCLGPVVFFGVVIIGSLPEASTLTSGLIGAGAMSVLYLFLIRMSQKRTAPRMAEKMLTDPENAKLIGPRKMTFSEEGIELKSETVDLKMSWKALVRAVDTGTHFLLYPGANQAYIVPKAKISPADIEELERLLKANRLL